MGSANGDRSQNRRKKRRGEQPLTPTAAGAMLSDARVGLGIELAEVHDRTGISSRNLEALESGEVQHFSEPSAAAMAMRRYAELVGLDPEPLIGSLSSGVLAHAGAPSVGAPSVGLPSAEAPSVGLPYAGAALVAGEPSWRPATSAEQSGHLRKYYGDQSHLHSFTQTAQVPAVGGSSGWGGSPYPGFAGGYAPSRRRRKAPLALRLFTWLVLFLLVVGAAGLGVDHYKAQWLRDIHVLRDNGRSASRPTSHKKVTSPPSTSTTVHAVVTSRPAGVGTVDVKVSTPNYSIFIATSGSCWVEARTALGANPLLNKTLLAGQTATIPVSGSPVALQFGSLSALIKVQVGGQTVAGWSLKPDAVPFYINFTSS